MIEQSVLDQALEAIFRDIRFQDEPAGLYDPLRYMVGLGGKRIRPHLCLLTYSLFQDSLAPEIFGPAAGLEVFHTFTLIHDDVMDRSALRRGQETVWKKWNPDTAILSGDVMCIDAYKRMALAPREVLPEVFDLFSRTAAQVCDGQQMDMDFESRTEVGMDEYMQMIGLKTGVLIACAARLGALIGGADAATQARLYDYGYQLGLAFQVADDYLDAYGDEKVFGKPIGGDILNGKKSWLTVRALEVLSAKDAAASETLLEALEAQAVTPEEKAEKIARVKAFYDLAGVPDDARRTISALTDQAITAASAAFAGPDASAEALRRLAAFAHSLVSRAK